jgi:hypothetical protein
MKKLFLIGMVLLLFNVGYAGDSGITGLTEDTAPVTGDFLVTKDTSAPGTRKVNILNCLNAQDCKNLVINGLNGGTFVVTYDILQVGNCSLTSGSFTVDVDGGTGVLKLDTGTYATNTWYYIWVICKANGGVPSAFISLSATAPTLPADYLYQRRVGSLRATSTSAYKKFHTNGNGWHWYETTYLIVSNGTQTSFTAVDNSANCPTTSLMFMGCFQANYASSGSATMNLRATGDTSTIQVYTNGVTVNSYGMCPMNTSQSFDYSIATGTAAYIYISGYIDNL